MDTTEPQDEKTKYLKNIVNVLKEGEGDTQLLATNALKEIKDSIYPIADEVLGSKTLEAFIRCLPTQEHVQQVLDAMLSTEGPTALTVLYHPYYTRVFETVLRQVEKFDDISCDPVYAWVGAISCEDWAQGLVRDRNASFTIRKIVETAKLREEMDKMMKCLCTIADSIIQDPTDMHYNSAVSPLLKEIFQYLPEYKATELAEAIFENARFSIDCEDRFASHVLQTALGYASSETIWSIVSDNRFKSNAVGIATHPCGTHVLKALLLRCDTPELFTAMYNVLKKSWKDIFEAKCYSIVHLVLEGCFMLETLIEEGVELLFNMTTEYSDLHKRTDKYTRVIKILLSLPSKQRRRRRGNPDAEAPVDRPAPDGSKILQLLFNNKFKDRSVLNRAFSDLPPKYLEEVATARFNSLALDGFLNSFLVKKEFKQKLVENLLKCDMARIASDRAGSHVVEAAWNQADTDQKRQIEKALKDNYNTIVRLFYGRPVLDNCHIKSPQSQFKKIAQKVAHKVTPKGFHSKRDSRANNKRKRGDSAVRGDDRQNDHHRQQHTKRFKGKKQMEPSISRRGQRPKDEIDAIFGF